MPIIAMSKVHEYDDKKDNKEKKKSKDKNNDICWKIVKGNENYKSEIVPLQGMLS